ncbi:hypothetical protein BC829DRAFT_413919 [Chytridium lagenaria]|nr:hypothetical protein BC829DRAFT_413919 [Chytridium lagenaria]
MEHFLQYLPSKITVDSLPDLTGRVAIITGASSGVGKVSAEVFAKKGIMAVPEFTLTVDKVEMQTASNHLGHFYMTMLLMPILRKTAADMKKKEDGFGLRVVNLSSMGHRASAPTIDDFDALNEKKGVVLTALYDTAQFANIYARVAGLFMITPEKGALTQIYCAVHNDIVKNGVKGQYFVPTAHLSHPIPAVLVPERAVKLWEWSEKIVNDRGFKLTL